MAIAAYSKSSGPIGQSIYTFVGVTAPQQFMPRLVATTKLNKAQTNTDFRISVSYPLLSVVDGVEANLNTIRCSVSFSALRNVIATAEKTRVLDEIIGYLTANKAKIIAGDVTGA